MIFGNDRKGFVLRECIVSCAAVALVSAVLYPIGVEIQRSAISRSDMELTLKINHASALYAEDNDARFVPAGLPVIDYSVTPMTSPKVDLHGKPWNGWGLKLAHYADGVKEFVSPIDSSHGSFYGPCTRSASIKITNTYAINWLLARDGSYQPEDASGYRVAPDGTPLKQPVTVGEIREPEHTISFLPSTAVPPFGSNWGCLFVTMQASDTVNRIVLKPMRNGGANVAFADGHGKWIESRDADPSLYPDAFIFHWRDRQVWMEPTMPVSSMGFRNTGERQ